MSVGAISAGVGLADHAGLSEGLKGLEKTLASGQGWEAQQAFTAFQKAPAGVPAQSAAQSVTLSSPQENMKIDLQGLENALAAGDITGAQEAFAAFKQDLQVAQRAVSPADGASQANKVVETESGASAVGASANDGNSAYAKGNRVDLFG